MDFNNISSIIDGFNKILKLSSIGGPPIVPTPLILVGAPRRSGLSPIKIASRIIARKSEAGLTVGVLPSGAVNPEEIMWRIAIEEIIRGFHEDAVVNIAIPPGITLTAAGVCAAGPVSVFGSTIVISKAYGIIQ